MLQIRQVKAFVEPAVDRDNEVAGFSVLILVSPQTRKGKCGTQLQRLSCALAGKCQSRMKTLLDFAHVMGRQKPSEFAL